MWAVHAIRIAKMRKPGIIHKKTGKMEKFPESKKSNKKIPRSQPRKLMGNPRQAGEIRDLTTIISGTIRNLVIVHKKRRMIFPKTSGEKSVVLFSGWIDLRRLRWSRSSMRNVGFPFHGFRPACSRKITRNGMKICFLIPKRPYPMRRFIVDY